jgi:hypothetical protein
MIKDHMLTTFSERAAYRIVRYILFSQAQSWQVLPNVTRARSIPVSHWSRRETVTQLGLIVEKRALRR